MTSTKALDAPASLSKYIESHRDVAATLELAELLRGNVPLLGIVDSAGSPNAADGRVTSLGWSNSIGKAVRAAARVKDMTGNPEYWANLVASVGRTNRQHALDRYRFGQPLAGMPSGILMSTHQHVCGEEIACSEPLLMREFQFPDIDPSSGRPLSTYESVDDVYEFHSLNGSKLSIDVLMKCAMRSPRFRGSYSHQTSNWGLYEGRSPKQSAIRLGENFLELEEGNRLRVQAGRIYVASGMPIKEYYKVLTIVRDLDELDQWQAFDRVQILVSDNLGPNYSGVIGWMKLERLIIVNDEASIPNYTPQQAMVVRSYFEIRHNWLVRLWRENGIYGDKRSPAILHTHEDRRKKQEHALDPATAATMLIPTFARICALEGRDIDLAHLLGSSFFTNPPENLVDLFI